MAGAVPRPRRQGTLPPLLAQDRCPEPGSTSVTAAVQTGTYVDPALPNHGRRDGQQWLTGMVSLKPSTFALYESILGTHVLPRRLLIQVEHGEVQAWVAGLVASGLSPSHVRDTVGVLAGVLGLAVRDRRPRRARTPLRTICGLFAG
jgi:hypothetical protein